MRTVHGDIVILVNFKISVKPPQPLGAVGRKPNLQHGQNLEGIKAESKMGVGHGISFLTGNL